MGGSVGFGSSQQPWIHRTCGSHALPSPDVFVSEERKRTRMKSRHIVVDTAFGPITVGAKLALVFHDAA
jgi:hypothetical protein